MIWICVGVVVALVGGFVATEVWHAYWRRRLSDAQYALGATLRGADRRQVRAMQRDERSR